MGCTSFVELNKKQRSYEEVDRAAGALWWAGGRGVGADQAELVLAGIQGLGVDSGSKSSLP